MVQGRLENGAIVNAYFGVHPYHGSGYRFEIYGKEGTLAMIGGGEAGEEANRKIMGGHKDDKALQELPVPERLKWVPEARAQVGPPYDVGQMWVKFAEAIRTGKSHRARLRSRGAPPPMLDAIVRASETGQRQRDQQYVAGEGLRRPSPRASPLRRRDRPRDAARGGAACATSRSCASCMPLFTIVLTIGAAGLGHRAVAARQATTGDVILVCTLGLAILHATRDLAVALVDVTQHMARFAEALADAADAARAARPSRGHAAGEQGASVAFERVSFRYPDGRRVFAKFNLDVEPGPAGRPGRPLRQRQSTLFALSTLLRRAGRPHPDRRPGRRAVTQDSLRDAIARRAAGCLAVPSLGHGKHPLRPARGHRRQGSGRGIAARCDFIEQLPDGFEPSSALAASSCPAGSASASPSPAPS